jgi:hypothetical protein
MLISWRDCGACKLWIEYGDFEMGLGLLFKKSTKFIDS